MSDAIEPSNYEQAGWSDLTYEYVQALRTALDAEKARADAAEAALKTAREALADAVDFLALAENPAWPDPKYHNEVKSMGLRIGFGALMATASAGWREYLADQGYPTGGEHVAGPCLGTVKATLARMRAVLAALDAKGEPK